MITSRTSSWLAAPRVSSHPSLTRSPPADRLAPTPPHARPLRSSPEQSRATPLPSAASPTPGATIVRRPATKRAPPPVGDSESGQILWSLIHNRSVGVFAGGGRAAAGPAPQGACDACVDPAVDCTRAPCVAGVCQDGQYVHVLCPTTAPRQYMYHPRVSGSIPSQDGRWDLGEQ